MFMYQMGDRLAAKLLLRGLIGEVGGEAVVRNVMLLSMMENILVQLHSKLPDHSMEAIQQMLQQITMEDLKFMTGAVAGMPVIL